MHGPLFLLSLLALLGQAAALKVSWEREAGHHHSASGGLGNISKSGAHVASGSLGVVGKRGFRTLGGVCWDSDVWDDQDFHMTRAMCAKTRSYRSGMRQAEGVLRKLHAGECITVVALGSSMTVGNCFICWNLEIPDRQTHAWPGQFKRWLDMKFPCDGDDAKGHTVHNLATAASDAGFWNMQVNIWKGDPEHPVNDADIIFVDTSVTDVQDALDSYPALDMPPQHEQDLILPNTELLVRQLKKLPKRPWLIFPELNWKNIWEAHIPGHWDAIMSHLPVLKYYDIDQVSYLDAFMPLSEHKVSWARRWLQVDGGHPSYLGHQVLAQIMAHTLMEESHFMNLDADEDGIMAFRRETPTTELPEPLWTEKNRAFLYDELVAIDLIPWNNPFQFTFEVHNFGIIGGRVSALTHTDNAVGWIVSLPLRDGQPRPLNKGYMSVGYRRSNVDGTGRIIYHVMPGVCGPDDGGNYSVGVVLSPWWTIPSYLRTNVGFEFDVPVDQDACMIVRLEWMGLESGPWSGDPWKFQIDDITILA